MLELRKVTVTGGLSCGKSSVCHFLSELGAKVVNADAIVHELLKPNTPIGQEVIELIGPDIVIEDKIDHEKIARRVFTHPKLLRSLESILHPAVYEEIEKQFEETKKSKESELFIADIPLLFETKGEERFDTTIAVVANREECWKRFRKSTGYEREEYNRRMARQLTVNEKAEKADYVIQNDGTLEDLKVEVKKLYDKLIGIEKREKEERGKK